MKQSVNHYQFDELKPGTFFLIDTESSNLKGMVAVVLGVNCTYVAFQVLVPNLHFSHHPIYTAEFKDCSFMRVAEGFLQNVYGKIYLDEPFGVESDSII